MGGGQRILLLMLLVHDLRSGVRTKNRSTVTGAKACCCRIDALLCDRYDRLDRSAVRFPYIRGYTVDLARRSRTHCL